MPEDGGLFCSGCFCGALLGLRFELLVARQVLTQEPVVIVPMAGEIRRLSFVVQPAHLTSEVRLTVYVSHQWYLDEASGFTTEELGLSTDPEIYRAWFEKLDRAVPR